MSRPFSSSGRGHDAVFEDAAVGRKIDVTWRAAMPSRRGDQYNTQMGRTSLSRVPPTRMSHTGPYLVVTGPTNKRVEPLAQTFVTYHCVTYPGGTVYPTDPEGLATLSRAASFRK